MGKCQKSSGLDNNDHRFDSRGNIVRYKESGSFLPFYPYHGYLRSSQSNFLISLITNFLLEALVN